MQLVWIPRLFHEVSLQQTLVRIHVYTKQVQGQMKATQKDVQQSWTYYV